MNDIKIKTIFNIIQSDGVGGGMENIFLEYSKILDHQKKVQDINLICIVPQKFCHLKILQQQNIQIKFLNIRGHFDIFAALKLWCLIKKYKPELIITHNGRTSATVNLCQKFSKKTYQTLAINHGGNIKRILGFDYIICVAKHIERKIISSNFKGIIKTIYNGYKISSFTKNNQSKDNFVFGILSRLSKEKNIGAAITMFKKFNDEVEKNSLLIVAGEGQEKFALEKLVQEHNLQNNVKFIGWIKNQAEFFNQIDVFLQPALNEPFGMTILEAFNYQTPVISCNSFGPQEIIIDGYNGYLFEPTNIESLFLAMKKSYLEKENFPIMTQNAHQELREKFSYEIMEKNLLEFIETIIK
ncbi:MAG: glycosyltransferase [Pseudomonadota bacterium]